jgi:hypothetical protein
MCLRRGSGGRAEGSQPLKNGGNHRRLIVLGGLVILFVVCFLLFWSRPDPTFPAPEVEETITPAQPLILEPEAPELIPEPEQVVPVSDKLQPLAPVPEEPEAQGEVPLIRCSVQSDLQLPDTEVTVFEQSPAGSDSWLMLEGKIQSGSLEFRSQKLTSHGSVTIPNIGQFPLDWQGDSCTLVLTEPTYVSGKLNPPPPSDLRVTVGGCGAFTDDIAQDGAFTLNVTETDRCRLVVRANKVRLEEVYVTPDAGNEIVLDIEVSDYERARSASAPR